MPAAWWADQPDSVRGVLELAASREQLSEDRFLRVVDLLPLRSAERALVLLIADMLNGIRLLNNAFALDAESTKRKAVQHATVVADALAALTRQDVAA